MTSRKVITLLSLLPFSLFGQMESYTWAGKLGKAEKEGYHAVVLPPVITGRSISSLSDLRLYQLNEKDTLEIPYLFQWNGDKSEQAEITFERINDSYNEKCCSYLTLKFDKQKVIDAIRLEVSESNFDKSIKIEGSADNKSWVTVRDHLRIVGFSNGSENYNYTWLRFPASQYNYFRLMMNDEGSPRISILNAYAYETKIIKGNYTGLKVNSQKTSENKKDKTTEVIVELDNNYRVNHLNLSAKKDKDFYRNVNVYYLSSVTHAPKGDIENWSLLNTSVLSSLDNCYIDCYNQPLKKIKVEVINHDDQPVELEAVKAFAENCWLIARLPQQANVWLAYGKENDNTPKYDMEHFSQNIPSVLPEVLPGEEIKIKAAVIPETIVPLIMNKVWLWVVMGVLILFLGVFSFRMLKNSN